MGRQELVQMFVLNEVSDDYEEFAKIQAEVRSVGATVALRIEAIEITQALTNLIENGLVKAYRLAPGEPIVEIVGCPRQSEIDRCYFWQTNRGREVHAANCQNWPIADDGSLREDLAR